VFFQIALHKSAMKEKADGLVGRRTGSNLHVARIEVANG
jgi:hypothetical protein